MTARRVDPLRLARLSRGDPRRAGRRSSSGARSSTASASVLGGDLESRRGARAEADARGDDRRRAAQHGVRDPLRDRDRAPPVPGHGARQRARRPADGAVAGRRRAVALPALRPPRLVRRRGSRVTASACCSRIRGFCSRRSFVSLPFVVREVVPVLREIGTEQEEAAATLGARHSRRSGGSRCRRSAGPSRTASC